MAEAAEVVEAAEAAEVVGLEAAVAAVVAVVVVVVVVVVVDVVEAPSMAVAEEEAVEHADGVEEPVDCCSLTVDWGVVLGA